MSILKTKLLIPIQCILILTSFSIWSQAPNYPTSPENKQLIVTDLIHFEEALNLLKPDSDTIQILKTHYFDKGTPGLKEFVNRHGLTADLLKKAIISNKDIYEQIPSFIKTLDAFKEQLQEDLIQFQNTLPKPMYAPTYLLVGANRGIAQASFHGQLVTVTKVLNKPELLTKLIIHELSHFQQAMAMGGQKYVSLYSQPNNMLELCLREGGAEFLTFLITKEITQPKALKHIADNSNSLKKRFLSDLKAQDQSFWLWESLNQNEYPKLLGYAMGFEICKSYYDRAENKNQAIKDILIMENAKQFMEKSQYFE
jgi:uncharacterized protein YjaZ